MSRLTKPPQIALKKLYNREWEGRPYWEKPESFLKFRRTVKPAIGLDCVIVPWCGIFLGIETDGYTHS